MPIATDTATPPAAPRPEADALIDVPPGLTGVVAADTRIGDVRGREGFYHYGPYSAVELAEHRRLDEVWHLVERGELPTAGERARFRAEIAAERARPLPAALRAALPAIAAASPTAPLDGLRTAVSLLAAAEGMAPSLDVDRTTLRDQGRRVAAVLPVIVAALHRLAAGEVPIPPDPSLDPASDYLRMITGTTPTAEHARAVERYLVTTIDHGFNASTFTARVVASTGADVGAAVVAAIGALSGPLHGGAPARALDALDAIGHPDRLEAWARPRIAAGERMMGFGHAVYRTRDPRAALLARTAHELGGELVQRAAAVETGMVALLAELKPGRELHANVEYWAGVVMALAGIPRTLFTPTFATSRAIGWVAHVVEQVGAGKIIRPSARYVGPPAPRPLP